MTAKPYTDAEATDEALRLFTRKLRRLHPDAFEAVWLKLPEGARTALQLAENRADSLRWDDDKAGTAHRYLTDAERYDDDDPGEVER